MLFCWGISWSNFNQNFTKLSSVGGHVQIYSKWVVIVHDSAFNNHKIQMLNCTTDSPYCLLNHNHCKKTCTKLMVTPTISMSVYCIASPFNLVNAWLPIFSMDQKISNAFNDCWLSFATQQPRSSYCIDITHIATCLCVFIQCVNIILIICWYLQTPGQSNTVYEESMRKTGSTLVVLLHCFIQPVQHPHGPCAATCVLLMTSLPNKAVLNMFDSCQFYTNDANVQSRTCLMCACAER